MFKVVKLHNIASEIMKELFAPKMSPYDLRNNNSFKSKRVNSVWHGTESVSYLGPKIKEKVTRRRSTKRLKHTGNILKKNLQLTGVCWF